MTGSILLRSRKARADVLDETLNALAGADDERAERSQELRWLAEDCVHEAARLKAAFDDGQRGWPATPVEDLHAYYAEFLAVVGRQLLPAGQVRERAATACQAAALTALDEAIRSLGKLREEVAGLCQWLIAPVEAPFLLPDRSAAERRAAFERGEYESAGDALERLRNGGPLEKE